MHSWHWSAVCCWRCWRYFYRWKRQIIFKAFNNQDTKKILQIPISLSGREDSNYWIRSETGQYTVKLAYNLLCDWRMKRGGGGRLSEETSVENNSSKIWKKLWKLGIKEKLKHFLWKCIYGTLLVNNQVFNRTGRGDPIYKRCGEQVETIEHMLLNCRRAKDVWKMAPV